MSESYKVEILGNEYLVKSEEDEEQVQRIAAYVNEKLMEMQEKTERLSAKKTAILVALNIASDYFQLVKERDELKKGLRQRTEDLVSQIDSAIG